MRVLRYFHWTVANLILMITSGFFVCKFHPVGNRTSFLFDCTWQLPDGNSHENAISDFQVLLSGCNIMLLFLISLYPLSGIGFQQIQSWCPNSSLGATPVVDCWVRRWVTRIWARQVHIVPWVIFLDPSVQHAQQVHWMQDDRVLRVRCLMALLLKCLDSCVDKTRPLSETMVSGIPNCANIVLRSSIMAAFGVQTASIH